MDLIKIGKKIRELRETKGLTQGDLAKISGVNRATISETERAKRQYSRSIDKILKALDFRYDIKDGAEMVKDISDVQESGNQFVYRKMTMGLIDFRDSDAWHDLKVTRDEEYKLKNLPMNDNDRFIKEDYIAILQIIRRAKNRIKSKEQKE